MFPSNSWQGGTADSVRTSEPDGWFWSKCECEGVHIFSTCNCSHVSVNWGHTVGKYIQCSYVWQSRIEIIYCVLWVHHWVWCAEASLSSHVHVCQQPGGVRVRVSIRERKIKGTALLMANLDITRVVCVTLLITWKLCFSPLFF